MAVLFDSTIVAVAIHRLASDLDVGLDVIQWVSTAYLLALAVFIPIATHEVIRRLREAGYALPAIPLLLGGQAMIWLTYFGTAGLLGAYAGTVVVCMVWRLVGQGIKGTGTAASIKGGLIVTATGLVFATAADRKVHVYDSATGTQLSELQLGGNTTGAPSMYELNGRQYLLVTSSPIPGAGGRGDLGVPTSSGPTGITAFALPKP